MRNKLVSMVSVLLFLALVFFAVPAVILFLLSFRHARLIAGKKIRSEPTPTAVPSRARAKVPVAIHPSDTFDFQYTGPEKHVTVTEKGAPIAAFDIPETPFAAWIHEPTKAIAVVSTEDGNIDSPHDVYVFRNGKLRKVYTGKAVKLGEGEGFTDKEHIYGYWSYTPDEMAINRQRLRTALDFSPKGSFLFLTILVYEGTKGEVINLDTGESADNGGLTVGKLYWSPTGECFMDMGTPYGDTQLAVVGRRNTPLFTVASLKEFAQASLESVAWTGSCSGIASVNTTVWDENNNYTQVMKQFAFTGSQFEEIAALPDKSVLKESMGDFQENIYLTVLR